MKPSIPFYRVQSVRPNLYLHTPEQWEIEQRAEQAHDQRLARQELAVEIVVVLLIIAAGAWVIAGMV